jgi:hypothetical protein
VLSALMLGQLTADHGRTEVLQDLQEFWRAMVRQNSKSIGRGLIFAKEHA